MRSYCKPNKVNIMSVKFNLRAVCFAFDHKLDRDDFLYLIVDTGVATLEQLHQDAKVGQRKRIVAGLDILARRYTQEIRTMNGSIEFRPVRQFQRLDGISGKLRDLCQESPKQQVYEYIVVNALDELFKKRIYKQQYGSIPGGGQLACAKQIAKQLRTRTGNLDSLQGDDHHAYHSVSVDSAVKIIRHYCHKNEPVVTLTANVMRNYPGGHLIIGGYLCAYIFNLVKSEFLRVLMAQGHERRGKFTKYVAGFSCYADDFVIFGKITNLIKAVKKAAKWYIKTFGVKVKDAWKIAHFVGFDRVHKHRESVLPRIDMAGFVVTRTVTLVRKRIFRRIRRQFMRAWADLNAMHFVQAWRAHKLSSYYGWIKYTASTNLIEKYHVKTLLKAAKSSLRREARRKESYEAGLYDQAVAC